MTPLRLWIAFALMAALFGCGGGGAGGGGNLEIVTAASFPTNIRFSPDGRLFFTEKATGQVRIVDNGTLLPTPFATLSVGTDGEQGLLGLCFDPNYASNHHVYVFYSLDTPAIQRIARFTDVANIGTNFTVILDNLPRSSHHDGGKICFGQDGKLYATLGDVEDPANAQNASSLAGKVLRMNPDGSIPGDNPTPGSYVYTLGHRNCFGIAVHPSTGTLYVSENGPNFDDELNRLSPGGNYGWRPGQPQGDTDPNYLQPVRRYTNIIAPTGIVFYQGAAIPGLTGSLLMANFVEGTVRRLTIDDSAPGSVVSESVWLSGLDGPTDVTVDAAGNVYIATPTSILRVVPGP